MRKCLVFIFIINITLVFSQNNDSVKSIHFVSLDDLLFENVNNGKLSKASDLIKEGAKVNAISDNGVTPIFFAIEKGDVNMVNLLISNNADVNFRALDETGEAPLILAAKLGNAKIIDALLRDSAKTDLKNTDGAAALHFAAFYNDTVIVKMLCENNATVDITDNKGITPLAYAASNGSSAALKMLILFGADVNKADRYKNTPLVRASANGHYNNAVILLENWAAINAGNNRNYTPLYYSIVNNYPQIADLLLLNGANFNENYSLSLSPLSLAKLYKQNNLADSLKKMGARRNYLPSFHNMGGVGVTTKFNNRDFLVGLKYLAKDEKFNFEYSLYYNIRPFSVPVLQKMEDSSYFQFRERRNVLGFSLGKFFPHQTGKGGYIGPFLEALYEFHWGKYRGTDISINSGFHLSPCIGMERKSKNTVYRLSFIYRKSNITGLPDWSIEFSLLSGFHKQRSGTDMSILP
jgi:ankyrin repeat protein